MRPILNIDFQKDENIYRLGPESRMKSQFDPRDAPQTHENTGLPKTRDAQKYSVDYLASADIWMSWPKANYRRPTIIPVHTLRTSPESLSTKEPGARKALLQGLWKMTREGPANLAGVFQKFAGLFSGTITNIFRDFLALRICFDLDLPFPAPKAPQEAKKK